MSNFIPGHKRTPLSSKPEKGDGHSKPGSPRPPHPTPRRKLQVGTRCCSPPGTQEAGGPGRTSPQPRLPGSRRAPSSKSRRGSRAASARGGDPQPVVPGPCPAPTAGRAAASRHWALDGLGRGGCAAPAPGGEDSALGSSRLSSTGLIRPLTARPLAARAAGARATVTPEGGTVGRGRGAGAGRGAEMREPGAGGAGCG